MVYKRALRAAIAACASFSALVAMTSAGCLEHPIAQVETRPVANVLEPLEHQTPDGWRAAMEAAAAHFAATHLLGMRGGALLTPVCAGFANT